VDRHAAKLGGGDGSAASTSHGHSSRSEQQQLRATAWKSLCQPHRPTLAFARLSASPPLPCMMPPFISFNTVYHTVLHTPLVSRALPAPYFFACLCASGPRQPGISRQQPLPCGCSGGPWCMLFEPTCNASTIPAPILFV
jgi:hypothetical protein